MIKKTASLRSNSTLRALEAEISKLQAIWGARRPGKATKPAKSDVSIPTGAASSEVDGKISTSNRAEKEQSSVASARRALSLNPPPTNFELREAHEIARRGDYDVGIFYARVYVPQHLQYTIETLLANAALSEADEVRWLRHLNNYVRHFGAAEIILRDGDTLLQRFSTNHLPPVTGGPLVSVIMPAWNAEKTIRAAAQSILDQTWKNIELIIIDDASEDGTWAQMQALASLDDRVRIFRNKINVGPYVSKNIMLSIARGEWITGHDADDWAHPQRLEHHVSDVLKAPKPPRASVTYMIRLEEDGMMDRFAPISDYSLDGIARDSAISCMYEADFLHQTLGSWDNVRFGADSEMISRTQALIGEEFRKIPRIGMLCMNLEGSLTNNVNYGVDRTAGPSQIRRDYSAAWMKWHKALDNDKPARLTFPPAEGIARPFPAPDAATVPIPSIRRNHAAITGMDPICDEAVTAICPSKRPWFLARVAEMLKSQTHKNLHVIYIAHGPGHDIEAARASFAGLASVTVLEFPDVDATLGEALNLALSHCKTDLVTKIDDDDFYGPNYIRSSIAALYYSGHSDVGIVGRERAYCYSEERNILALRYGLRHENSIRERVFGGTIFWSRSRLSDQHFIHANTGEDTNFFVQARKKGVKIFATEAQDYVHVRYAQTGVHTWNIGIDDFLKSATIVSEGLRLDVAYSSPMPKDVAAVPSHTGWKSSKGGERLPLKTDAPSAVPRLLEVM